MLWALEQKIFPLENFWKNKKENILDTIDSTLKVCHKVMLPITSCECKRPISAMGNKRLSSLSLMHVHYDKAIKVDEVVTLFC